MHARTTLVALAGSLPGLLALTLPLLGSPLGCTGNTGRFDGGNPQPDQEPDALITGDDIGTLCTYNPASGENPTNQCKDGMTCLIYTRDGAYTPYSTPNSPVYESLWEDQTTQYNADGTDEGYCTLVYTWQQIDQQLLAPPYCPDGSLLRRFNGGLMACMKLCSANNQCRSDQVCDFRYLDLEAADIGGNRLGHCVKPCSIDVPDCVRGGWIPTQADPTMLQYYLAIEDFLGYSVCNQGTGLCDANPTNGTKPPGSACTSTEECAGTVCLPAPFLDPTLPVGTPGMCAGPCAPNAQDPFMTCTAGGYACQEGFKNGHNPFNVKTLGDGTDNTMGGWCLPSCQGGLGCETYEGTTCGQPDSNVWGAGWNGVSMCMIPGVLAGN